MPFHLELGSDGHSFNGKAIVVNSITGRHLSHNPIPMEKAKAQKRVVEQAVAEHGEHVTASGKPDGRKKVKAPAPAKAVSKMQPLSGEEAKKIKAQLVARKTSGHSNMSTLEGLIKKALKKESSKVFQKDSGGEDSERSYSFAFDKPAGYNVKDVEKVLFKLIPEHHETLKEREGQWEYEFMADVDAVNEYLKKYIYMTETSELSNLERKLMDAIAGADTVKHVGNVVSSPSDMVKKIVMSHYDKSVFGRDAESKEHTHFRSKINRIDKYLKKVDNADHQVIYDMLKD